MGFGRRFFGHHFLSVGRWPPRVFGHHERIPSNLKQELESDWPVTFQFRFKLPGHTPSLPEETCKIMLLAFRFSLHLCLPRRRGLFGKPGEMQGTLHN